jgi:hypothetical protein
VLAGGEQGVDELEDGLLVGDRLEALEHARRAAGAERAKGLHAEELIGRHVERLSKGRQQRAGRLGIIALVI